MVLWDIDHTLITSGGVGSEVFRTAFETVTGCPMTQMAEVTGRTERVIFRETLELHDLEDPGDYFDRFAQAQARGYWERAEDMRRRGRALSGAPQALRALAEHGDVVQSVLTGNTRPSALAKLQIFDLHRHIDFDSGAYGDDEELRTKLVPIARARANERHHFDFDVSTTVLIGDTPSDVRAALDGGALVIGVATGKSSPEELAEAGAHHVLSDLSDTTALVRAVVTIEQLNG
ncbi:phosphoglycolate phosphatase-like HAD superfamily hydrolase [Streptosporangium lutulentum]|uniref:Phosphoglycolate phosphatase-like HAD superfamily hydrolase n=1 Tax=Streptosporangium lutulentum TaxID=1461250 RepID=A0ABT9QD50_9ACTN|nr:phosphoglycolate phosphatase-like HAD superfamily hydrolase [Streptosporangium lutulentum]